MVEEFVNEMQEVYCRITIPEHNGYIYLQWYGTYISVEEIARAGLWQLDRMEELGITRIINDNRNLDGSWDHSNEWNGTVWLPRALSIGVNKLAHIISSNIFEKLSAEEMRQLFAEKLDTHFFKDFASAEAWVMAP